MNLEEYLGGLKAHDPLQLVIVGKDPYPNDATGIPFHKSEGQFKENCSGGVVLKSIGCDEDRSIQTCGDTLNLFLALRDVGIVFLNAVYRTDPGEIGRRIGKARDLAELKAAYGNYNRPVLHKARHVVYCGEARKIQRWLEGAPQEDGEKIHAVPHPDTRNRHSPYCEVQKKYKEWWCPGAVKRKCSLKLPEGVMART